MKNLKPGRLFLLVGPGGGGKNTLINHILDKIPNVCDLITYTTRDIRDGEIEGVDYHFVDLDEFQRMIQDKELVEFEEIVPGQFSGTPRAPLEEIQHQGAFYIADIDANGAEKLRQFHPDLIVMIFITVPGDTVDDMLEILRQRMESRDDDQLLIEQRLERARNIEFPYMKKCKYIVVNDDPIRAGNELEQIIRDEQAIVG